VRVAHVEERFACVVGQGSMNSQSGDLPDLRYFSGLVVSAGDNARVVRNEIAGLAIRVEVASVRNTMSKLAKPLLRLNELPTSVGILALETCRGSRNGFGVHSCHFLARPLFRAGVETQRVSESRR